MLSRRICGSANVVFVKYSENRIGAKLVHSCIGFCLHYSFVLGFLCDINEVNLEGNMLFLVHRIKLM